MNRRHFLKNGTLATSGLAAGLSHAAPEKAILSGIQIAPVTLLDQGIETCLDFLQKEAGPGFTPGFASGSSMRPEGGRPSNEFATWERPAAPPSGRGFVSGEVPRDKSRG